MYFFIKMFLSLISAIFVAGAALLLFNQRYINAKKAFLKDFLKQYVQDPTDKNSKAVNRLSLKVDDLNNNFKILGNNQHEDHKLIISHEKELDRHEKQLSYDQNYLKWLDENKANKKRGNEK